MSQSSLLQDVLRPTATSQIDQIATKLNNLTVPEESPSSTRATSPLATSSALPAIGHGGSAKSPVISPTKLGLSPLKKNQRLPRGGGGVDSSSSSEDDDEELIGVISIPGTPRRLQSRAQSRSTSPTRLDLRGAAARRAPGPLHLTSSASGTTTPIKGSSTKVKSKTDPVRVLTTELTQRVFALLGVKDLANASRVCLKWNKSQSLNYIWFLQNRKLEFGDAILPTGKWTRRESKENWRKKYMHLAKTISEVELSSGSRYGYAQASPTPAHFTYSPRGQLASLYSNSNSHPNSNYNYNSYPHSHAPSRGSTSGYSTPARQEEQAERWASEALVSESKSEMRDMYKELGGRKSRGKNKVGMAVGGGRDKGGWDVGEDGF